MFEKVLKAVGCTLSAGGLAAGLTIFYVPYLPIQGVLAVAAVISFFGGLKVLEVGELIESEKILLKEQIKSNYTPYVRSLVKEMVPPVVSAPGGAQPTISELVFSRELERLNKSEFSSNHGVAATLQAKVPPLLPGYAAKLTQSNRKTIIKELSNEIADLLVEPCYEETIKSTFTNGCDRLMAS